MKYAIIGVVCFVLGAGASYIIRGGEVSGLHVRLDATTADLRQSESREREALDRVGKLTGELGSTLEDVGLIRKENQSLRRTISLGRGQAIQIQDSSDRSLASVDRSKRLIDQLDSVLDQIEGRTKANGK